MKRKLFIGSSSEGLSVAEQVKFEIERQCGEWVECVLWNEQNIFAQNKSFLDSLVKSSRRFDYGILVATADDVEKSRKVKRLVPRDNVLFEMGLFLGSLGLTRAFLIADAECKLPSDYFGVSISIFKKATLEPSNIEGLISQLNQTRDSFSLKTIPSASLAMGYFENFVKPFAKSQLGKNGKLTVWLPTTNLSEIASYIDVQKSKISSKEVSVFPNGGRPFVHQSINNEQSFWDVPTTLKILNELINKIIPSEEIGDSAEKREWIGYELRNFKGTIELLVANDITCKGNVIIEWLTF
ncbi:MAG: nucleotide-binding protein [Marinilabiliaceae bacterium]|nr:nucleotide-binding protein [Marinilabiliaceae bacterium]